MENKYPVYPVGLELKTTRGRYIIREHIIAGKYVYGYMVENTSNGKIYNVGYSVIHSSRYKMVSPAAEILYGEYDD
jgi:hypothetical protein